MTISTHKRDEFNAVGISLGSNAYIKANSMNGIIANAPTLSFGQIETTATVLPPTSGIAISLVSSNAADIGAVIMVQGLAANGVLMNPVIVTLNGTTPVAVATMSRVNRLIRVSGDIAGTVTAYNGSNVYEFLNANWLVSRSAHFCCPSGWKMGIAMLNASLLKNSNNSQTAYGIIQLEAKPFLSTNFGPLISFVTNSSGAGAVQVDQQQFTTFSGPFDFRMTVKASEANVDIQSFASFFIAELVHYPN